MKTHPLEVKLKKEGFFHIAGIDEAGRGPWAGPLVSAAVILPEKMRIPGLNDSKQLTEKQRTHLFAVLIKKAIFGVGIVTRIEIDNFGLGKALKLSYKRAIDGLKVKPQYVLIDGIGKYDMPCKYGTVKKGDTKIRVIAAASVIAKVVRDIIMDAYSLKYPNYGFEKHKGYGTRQHKQNLIKYGVSDLHRLSFAPIKELLNDRK